MTVQAKVAPASEAVTSATEQVIGDSIVLTAGDNIALALSPAMIGGYARQGADLLIQLKTGETIRIGNFYAPADVPSQLYLVDEEGTVVAQLAPAAADGSVAATYVAQGTPVKFSSLATAAEAPEGAGLGIGAILGGVAAVGGGLALAAGGGGGGGAPTGGQPTLDTTPPSGATGVTINPGGTQISGSAEVGGTVRIDTNGDGQADATGVVGTDGRFTVPLTPPLTNGQTVSVTVSDTAGNTSPAVTINAPDTTAPLPASEVVISADGTAISGKAEPGSTVRIDTNGDGQSDATGAVGTDGRFTVPLTPPLTNGQTVSVTVSDTAGNTSPAVTINAPDTTAPLPASEVVISADGTVISGKAEPGSTVGIDTDGNGQPNVTVVTSPGGQFQTPLVPPLTNGEAVTIVVTDPAGNSSAPSTVIAPDLSPVPLAPVIDPSNGTVIEGTAEAGNVVNVSAGGVVLGQATVAADGTWSFTPATPLADGVVVSGVTTNSRGESGPAATITIDGVAPATPVLDLSNGSVFTGTAEAGTVVTLTDGAGTTLGTVTANAQGAWTFAPAAPVPNGTVVNATASDAAGNASGPASVVVDSVAPVTPTVAPTTGAVFIGTAEAGSTVTLTDGAGNPIGQVVADPNGTWTFAASSPLNNGTVVQVVARDATGNASLPATVTVDSVAPPAPSINPSNGIALTGTAEANSTVTLKDFQGAPLGQAAADGNGNWTFTPAAPLANGAIVQATATDATGNTSPAVAITIDALAPPAPTILPSNGSAFSGTAEAGSVVTLTDGAGALVGTAAVDANGNWSVTPAQPVSDGTAISATARDAAGNIGTPASVIVDAVPPAAPIISPTNGNVIVGAAEANSLVTVSSNGVALGTTRVDAAGNWSFAPTTAPANGTTISATATDASGNVSAVGTTVVDSSLPTIPDIDPSNGTIISGIADAGNILTLTDGNGLVLTQLTVGSTGTWSFSPLVPLPDGTVIRAVAQNGMGVDSAPAFEIIDGVAPAAPTVDPSNGDVLSGLAEANAVITLSSGGGNIGTTVADANGNWTVTLTPALPDGTTVSVVATDAAGNAGAPAIAVIDAAAPAAPLLDASNGVFLTGMAEPGSIVTVSAGGSVLGTTTADINGDWVFTPAPPLANGAVVAVTATDAAGNVSVPASVTIDTVAPAAPTIDPTNGTLISGTAEANSIVTLTDGGGATIGTTAADATGNWSIMPATPLVDGTGVSARATDAAGNTGPAGTATVDAIAPSTPTVNISNGTIVTGTADAGVAISFMDGAVLIGTTVSDGAGNWTFTPTPALGDGTVVSVTASDAAGNDSAPATVTVDALAPIAPVIAPSDGMIVTGTAEAGTTITLRDGLGAPIGTATVDGNGNWTVTPSTPLPDGTALAATATDAAGNVSPAGNAVVDAAAPAIPSVDPSNGIIFSGTAEAGSTVTLADGSTVIGQVVADVGGNWSFIPNTPVANAVVITVSASDAAGNDSLPATVTVDALAPAAPVLAPSNGVAIVGTAEANASITLTDGAGGAIGQTNADASGNWTFSPATPLGNGTVVLAAATDAAGNTGSQGAVIIDAIAPGAPSAAPSNGTVISGTAEAGAAITLVVGGSAAGPVIADSNGNWTFTPGSPVGDGTQVDVRASDAAGNIGPATTIFVDALAPAAPFIAPTNGVRLVGTAEALSTVAISSAGTPLGTATTDGNGNWSFMPATPIPDAALVSATAKDAAGNISGPGFVTVDASLPSVPVIAPSNGTEIHGTADLNNTVTLTDGNGNPIGVVAVDGAGNWSFTPLIPLGDGTLVNAVAENPSNSVSAAAVITIDGVAPAAPVINATNGTEISGTAEAGATITLTDGIGGAIGTTVADGAGNWTFTPGSPLGNATVVNAVATDAAGNDSPQGSVIVDAVAPGLPVINPSNGVLLTGTAEANSTLTLTDGNGNPLGTVAVNGGGNWALVPNPTLGNGVTVNASATDASGNTGPAASTVIDSLAPAAPTNLVVAADGSVLTGTAEANSQVRVIVDGDTANPVFATTNGSGAFTATFASPLVVGQTLQVTATDAANNVSPPAFAQAPDLVAPSLAIAEAADGFVNAAEMSNGIQVAVGLTAGADVGDAINVQFVGQNGYVANQSHIITAGERIAGTAAITLTPPAGMAAYPQGASSVTASINGSTLSNAVNFVVDTVRPQTPVLSLVGNILTISGEPQSELIVEVNLGGVTATVTVTADNSGLASVNLLTDLDIDPTWDQLLMASVSVRGEDPAGNQSNIATLALGGAVGDQIVTIGNFGIDVALLPPTLGFSGRTESGSTVSVEIVTPAITAVIAPPVDSVGNFAVNLLSPAVFSQLGLGLSGLLNLGAGLSFNVVSTDSDGNESARYGVNLLGSGIGLNIGQVTIIGDGGVDLLSGTDGRAEVINAQGGDDLILHVGSGDVMNAGDGNDTIELSAANFASVDGGTGFDTILLDNGIDIDYNGPGIGTWSNIERIDLGSGDSGSVLTLTSAEVDAVTDSDNILQITGEANDQLVVTGAVNTGTEMTLGGLVYDVYTFGNTTLYIEENTVAVVA